jgi:hypothetical protein
MHGPLESLFLKLTSGDRPIGAPAKVSMAPKEAVD